MAKSKISSWPPRKTTCAATRKEVTCPAAKTVIIRQDMLPARSSKTHVKGMATSKPADSNVVTVGVDKYNRLGVQWPPKQPTMAARRSTRSMSVVTDQASLPSRTTVAGIRSRAEMTVVQPADTIVAEEQTTVQWPPHRPSMAVRHIITGSVDDRRQVWFPEDSDNLDFSKPSPRRMNLGGFNFNVAKRTSLPPMVCKPWRIQQKELLSDFGRTAAQA